MESRPPAGWLKDRLRFEVLLVAGLLITALFVWVGFGRSGLLFLVATPLVLPLVARKELRGIRNKFRGARGELQAARKLEPLKAKGYQVLHDLETGHGNIDHVVVGPTGVFVLETKAWRGRMYLGKGPRLFCNGADRTDAVKQTLGAVIEIRRRLARTGSHGWIQGYIVLTATRLRRGPISLRHVTVLEIGDLVREIESRPTSLSPRYVALGASAILDPR